MFSLVTLGFVGVFVSKTLFESDLVKATSVWTQESDADFNNGNLDNLEVVESGSNAELKLRLNSNVGWNKKEPANNPKARTLHSMASIWGTDKVLLFGGYYSDGVNTTEFNDTWIYDLSENNWIKMKPKNHPNFTQNCPISSVYGDDKVVLYTEDRIWIYDLSENNWTKKIQAKSPSYLGSQTMAPIFGMDRILLFGGSIMGDGSNETWVYDVKNNTWTDMNPVNKPPGLYGHAMSMIYGNDKVIIFGGEEDMYTDPIDETWIYDFSDNNWTKKEFTYKPGFRYSHAMAYIYGTEKVILFGGIMCNDTWIYDLNQNNWSCINSKINPPKRSAHEMASIYGTNNILLFGGFNYDEEINETVLGDTWKFNFTESITSGTFISEPFDIGPEAYFKTLSWNDSIFNGTSIRFQLRSGLNGSDLNSKPFIGPDGSTSTYYTTSPSKIWLGQNNDRWIQYKVYMESTEIDLSPILNNVSICYNCIPSLDNPIVIPETGDVTKQFNFTVNYLDRDNDPPEYVRINIDGINYTMKESNGTDKVFLDGKSYWYSTKFKMGYHSYQFFASDGEANRATEIKYLNINYGPIDHIIVEPAFVTITTDEHQIFTAKCYDMENNLLDITPTWSVTGGGTIDQTGNFTATTPGEWIVYANYSDLSGSARIIVVHGRLHQIIISPQEPTITTDEYQLFTATGYDADRNLLEISPTWAINGGGIIDHTGNFTANTPGCWTIYANQSGISGNTTINVIPEKLNQIIITPQFPTITTDDFQLFNAIGYDADMNAISISPTWEVSGGGRIDQSGNFNATNPGIWIVYANQSGISGNTMISVTPGAPHSIIISPRYVEINVSESFVFTSKIYDADENELDIIPSWEVTGGGTIDNNGRFTATKPGIWIIYANSSGLSANATIKVIFVENYENIPSEEEDSGGGKTLAVGFEVVIFIVIIILIFTFIVLFKKKFKAEIPKDNEEAAGVKNPPQTQQSVAAPVTIIKPSSVHTSTTTPALIPTPKPLSLPGTTPGAGTTQPSRQPQGATPSMAKPMQSKLTPTIPQPLLPPASESNTDSNSPQQK